MSNCWSDTVYYRQLVTELPINWWKENQHDQRYQDTILHQCKLPLLSSYDNKEVPKEKAQDKSVKFFLTLSANILECFKLKSTPYAVPNFKTLLMLHTLHGKVVFQQYMYKVCGSEENG